MWKCGSRATRRVVGGLPLLAAAVVAGACGTDPPTPTGPTETTAPPIWAALDCAPPPGARVHEVPLAGTALPFQVWVEETSPARGTVVRSGDWFELRYRFAGPRGFTVISRVDVGVVTAPAGFRALSSGGCGVALTLGFVPDVPDPLLHVRVWVEAGTVPPSEVPRVFDRPPDYEASEPLPWTVMR